VNKDDPVSVTIADGKVIGYTIRGVTVTIVSFGDRANYNVRITKRGDKVASGFAHSPLRDGTASLTKQ
jgi:hypothetical protein